MKSEVTIPTDILRRTLAQIDRIIRPTPVMPVCGFINIVCSGSVMTVTGTDCQGWLEARIALPSIVHASALVDAKKLGGAIATAGGDVTTITFDNKSTKLIIKSGGAVYRLASLTEKMTFPEMVASNVADPALIINGREFARAMRKVGYAAAKNDIRHYLNGMALQVQESTIELVATNGHQLSKAGVSLSSQVPQPIKIVIPGAYFGILQRICEVDEVSLKIGHKLTVEAGDYACQIPLLEGVFPDWKRVVPADLGRKLTVSKDAMIAALGRVGHCLNEKQKTVKLYADAVTGSFVISSQADDNQVEDTILAKNEGLDIGLSHTYLSETVAAIEADEVEIYNQNSSSAVIFKDQSDPTWTGIIMPMRS